MCIYGHPVSVAHPFVETPTVYFITACSVYPFRSLRPGQIYFFGFGFSPPISAAVTKSVIRAVIIMYSVRWIWDRATYCPG